MNAVKVSEFVLIFLRTVVIFAGYIWRPRAMLMGTLKAWRSFKVGLWLGVAIVFSNESILNETFQVCWFFVFVQAGGFQNFSDIVVVVGGSSQDQVGGVQASYLRHCSWTGLQRGRNYGRARLSFRWSSGSTPTKRDDTS